MKLDITPLPLRLRHVFTISRGSVSIAENTLVTLSDGGEIGRGEATPYSPLSLTPGGNSAALETMRPVIESLPDDWTPQSALRAAAPFYSTDSNRGACCALDVALHDLWGRKLGLPLWKIWGLDPKLVPASSFTIGIDTIDTMLAKANEAKDHPIFKIKLGTDHDLDIVRALRNAFPDHVIRVDANCAWDVSRTIDMARALESLGIEFIEQPMPKEKNGDMARVRDKVGLPLIADESCVLPEDVPALKAGFHGVNVKLIKCGGLWNARRIIEAARAMDMKIMIGCMVESSVLIAAAYQLAPLVDWLDLDGNLLIDDDPFRFMPAQGSRPTLPDIPGIGVTER